DDRRPAGVRRDARSREDRLLADHPARLRCPVVGHHLPPQQSHRPLLSAAAGSRTGSGVRAVASGSPSAALALGRPRSAHHTLLSNPQGSAQGDQHGTGRRIGVPGHTRGDRAGRREGWPLRTYPAAASSAVAAVLAGPPRTVTVGAVTPGAVSLRPGDADCPALCLAAPAAVRAPCAVVLGGAPPDFATAPGVGLRIGVVGVAGRGELTVGELTTAGLPTPRPTAAGPT